MKANEVIELIEISERKFLGYEEAFIPGQNWVRLHFKYPVKLLLKGVDFATKEFFIYGVLYLLGLYGIMDFIQKAPLEFKPMLSNLFLPMVMFGPLFLVLFLPPSTYCLSRISSVIIEELSARLSGINIEGYIDILDIYEKQATDRITFIKKLYAFSWAIFVYIFNKIDASKIVDSKLLSKADFISLGSYMMILMLGFVCIQAYSKSIQVIFNSVRISLLDNKNL